MVVSSAQLVAFLGKFQLETSGSQLSPQPAKARQQLGLALYSLSQFVRAATQYRNQWLNQALDPSQTQYRRPEDSIIEAGLDQDSQALNLGAAEQLNLAGAPIAGWDFSPALDIDAATSVSAKAATDEGQPIFEPEFVERTAYLLEELSYNQPESSTTQALLTVDRLDLLLTLARAEAKRLATQLQDLHLQ